MVGGHKRLPGGGLWPITITGRQAEIDYPKMSDLCAEHLEARGGADVGLLPCETAKHKEHTQKKKASSALEQTAKWMADQGPADDLLERLL